MNSERIAVLAELLTDGSISPAESAELHGLVAGDDRLLGMLGALVEEHLRLRAALRPCDSRRLMQAIEGWEIARRPSQRVRKAQMVIARLPPRSRRAPGSAGRPRIWRLAALLMVALLPLSWWLARTQAVAPSPLAVLAAAPVGMDVIRGTSVLAGQVGMGLFSHDRIRLAAAAGQSQTVVILYPDQTRMQVRAGGDLELQDEAGAKRVQLGAGEVSCEVAHQPIGKPMRLSTVHAEIEVVGTRLRVQVDDGGTRLEVSEGTVRFTDRIAASTIEVTAGASTEARISRPAAQAIGTEVANGQQITPSAVGRAGAANLRVPGYAPELETVAGDVVITSNRTLRNRRFTGQVTVSGGDVVFEFCSFEHAPEAASAQLRQYNGGREAGKVTCNWCDFDPGLRGAQGTRFSCNAQFGERGNPSVNPPTTGSAFVLYRCRLQGCGRNVSVIQYRSSGSTITESLIGSPTHGGKNSPYGLEISSSDHLTLQRSRIEVDSATDQACISIVPEYGELSEGGPIIIQDNYLNGGAVPVFATWRIPNMGGGASPTCLNRVRFTGNHFGDASRWGRVCSFDSMNITTDSVYARANPQVLCWERSNIWAPDGEGVADPAKSPSGTDVAGLPHRPGTWVDSRNFIAGESWVWNGRILP